MARRATQSKTNQNPTSLPPETIPSEQADNATPATETDSPWKDLLSLLIQPFLAFFRPDLEPLIDWTQPVRVRDKELQKIIRKGVTGTRFVDKLLEVRLKGGRRLWILIHIEVQAEKEGEFPYRMFIYHVRLVDTYQCPVVSMAVLADTNQNWRPDSYEHDYWGTRLRLEYPIFKLLDYQERWEELEASDNPFALVVMAHLKAIETKQDMEARYSWRWELTRLLHEKGYSELERESLYRFLDWVMALPEVLERRFEGELSAWEEERKMPYMMGFERRAMDRGREEGVELGKQETLLQLMRIKFSGLPESVEAEVQGLDKVALNELTARILTAQTLAELGLGQGSKPANSQPQ